MLGFVSNYRDKEMAKISIAGELARPSLVVVTDMTTILKWSDEEEDDEEITTRGPKAHYHILVRMQEEVSGRQDNHSLVDAWMRHAQRSDPCVSRCSNKEYLLVNFNFVGEFLEISPNQKEINFRTLSLLSSNFES
ncbi:hypothetical protein AAES_39067 [Amazona aestiva]|uniref:Uncharacterized protein n=1 Tax=Amazona aestiva TaxID=12930 RepID=A0A0Q3TYK1_AMAAE|nr:hypothetical protein AAES_39067 [Amazona aestiva]